MSLSRSPLRPALLFLALALAGALPAFATTTGNLPWDSILGKIADSVQGPVLTALITLGICAGGAYWFFTESQRGLVQILKAVIVGGIVSGLTAFLATFGISMSLI